jgi:hypothetical protein
MVLKIDFMEYFESQKLREIWNGKPCNHPKLEKQYYVGAFLITYVCVQCGREFTISQKMEMDEEREKAKTAAV